MKNNTIVGIALVLVLIGGGVYWSSMQKNANQIEDLATLNEQNVSGDNTQTSDVQDSNQKTLNIVSAESKATYEIDEDLRGKPTHVVGSTNSIMGTVMLDANTGDIQGAEVKLDASTLKTDIEARDGNVKKLVLKSDQAMNQYITFTATGIEGASLPSGKEFPVKVTGDIKILGVSKSVAFAGTAKFSDDGSLSVNANTTLAYGDFGVKIPDFPFLANVSKTVKLSVSIVAR